ncbi:protein STRUBBELIG-RECEPTOR FAMILY 4-like [Papaver somniferum]|uniref:protein STRUBBELIG-RECEPTOR FAMILY 4-like n=1 Tax=Papaver somniferum TaxID=3469 RepID=UPI000E702A55|nr:protein STRUBBELIG-RECEPTOR FAMILY 4-like [Papaver somniferum]
MSFSLGKSTQDCDWRSKSVLKETGYQAPEITDPKNSNQLSDIYSYGVFLLELITGKSPALDKWGDDDEAGDLVQWVIYAIRSSGTSISVMDTDSRASEPSQVNSLKAVLKIALNCVLETPDQRPTLIYVVKLLKGILIDYMKQKADNIWEFSYQKRGPVIGVSEESKQITKGVSGNNSNTFRLGDLGRRQKSEFSCDQFPPLLSTHSIVFPDTTTKVSVELEIPKINLPFQDDTSVADYRAPNGCGKTTLANYTISDLLSVDADAGLIGEGNFGSVSKVLVGTTSSAAVKRLKPVDMGIREFEKHMEFVGSIRHENVVDLRAYYYSDTEKFLVYDYYAEGSVAKMMQGKPGAKPIWGSPKCHLAWDTRLRIAIGAAKGIAHLHTLNNGTFSHEITDPKKSDQLSDIYSYGVLLLELITGKSPALDKLGDNAKAVGLVQWVISEIHSKGSSIYVMDHDSRSLEPSQINSMRAVLDVAMKCVLATPEKRHTLTCVVKLLGDILTDYMKEKAEHKINV